jgi:DNA-binding SARP family transcriptional activator
MRFRVLGPISVIGANGRETLSRGRSRKILAAMLADANEQVSIDHLIEVVWENRPPVTARQQAQNVVGAIRKELRCIAPEATITGHAAYYRLELDPGQLDSLVFQSLRQAGDRLVATGDAGSAALKYEAALQLWRGPALHGVESPALAVDVARLEESRLHVIKSLVRLHFAADRHSAMIGQLTTWSRLYPYDEDLHCRLAEALHRCSRTAEGLAVLHRLRERLSGELHICPGPEVEAVKAVLLGASAALAAPSSQPELLAFIRSTMEQLSSTLTTLSDYERRYSASVAGG